jgi:putative flippase GtrA
MSPLASHATLREGSTGISGRVPRFAGVALLGFATQLLVLHLLVEAAGVHYAIATMVAVEAAILHNFVWHEAWTWRDRAASREGRLARLALFNGLTALVSILGNVLLMTLLVGALSLPLLMANAIAVAFLGVLNLVAADLWVFPPRRDTPSPGVVAHDRPARAAVGMRERGAGLALLVAIVVPAANGRAAAAELRVDTRAEWDRYVALTESRIDRELRNARGFLAADFDGRDTARGLSDKLRSGAIPVVNVVTRGGDGAGVDVGSGMVHHWRGAVFIPGASVDDLVAALQDPTGRRAHRQQDVLATRVLERSPDGLRLYLKLQRQSIVSVAYNTEHDVRYRWHGAGRASSRSVATRIAEIEALGTPQERERTPGNDRGFLWRLNSYWRYQAKPGGVVVELESLTLSRDLPWGLRTIARPLINIVARESIERTLSAMRSRFTAEVAASR